MSYSRFSVIVAIDSSDGIALNGKMPTLHWVFLGGSAGAMVLGIVNLFGVETLAGLAAATLLN